MKGAPVSARHFITAVLLNHPWSCVSPAPLYTTRYVHAVAEVDVGYLSVARAARKEGGGTHVERALTIAILHSLSPF